MAFTSGHLHTYIGPNLNCTARLLLNVVVRLARIVANAFEPNFMRELSGRGGPHDKLRLTRESLARSDPFAPMYLRLQASIFREVKIFKCEVRSLKIEEQKMEKNFLNKLYEMSNGDMSKSVIGGDLARAIGLIDDPNTFRGMAQQLEHEELINVNWVGSDPAFIYLTPHGLSELQAAGQSD
jgi:hypothetical protein